MTIDHRQLPGIEFVPAPGPLRHGDYFDYGEGVNHVDGSIGLHTKGIWSMHRVIPHVRPLEVPEPCEPETPEVITWTSPVCGTFRIGAAAVDFDKEGNARGNWFFEDELLTVPLYVVNVCAGGAR